VVNIVNPVSKCRDGFICIVCGTVYEFKCTASECPYMRRGRKVGMCLVMNKHGEFDACEYLRIKIIKR